MPPDTKAPPPRRLSNAQIEQQIQDKLKSESELANTNVSVKADGKSVQLSGTVDTDHQHDLALRIAAVYSGDRTVVDKIQVRRQT
jgi:osmotically-inducible protein OsmY